ncbi:hypothetical protein BDY24DRAFT_415557 [Mrakia frigida]|uniref:retromer subunit VPS17 n=1 Tax=Mrakia frigida TaxID=29902 RepID=UPI003FCBF7FD
MSFDPLSPSAAPSWPSSPHQPSDLPPHLSPSSPAMSPSNSRSFSSTMAQQQAQGPPPPQMGALGSAGEQYAKERQVYGAPSPSMMSPTSLSSPNQQGGGPPPKLEPYLRVKISNMERNRKDLLIRFDATTNLPNFRTQLYKNIQRSYVEFRLFADQLSVGNPQTIVSALPLPQSSAITDEEDDRLVRIAIQRWFSRIAADPVLLQDEELRSFVESDFGYNPIPRPKRKAPSSFPLQLPLRKGPHDDDEELASAKFEVAKLDGQFAEAAKSVDKLSKARKSLAASEVDFGSKLVTSATTEQVPPLGAAMRKLGRALDAIAGMQHAQSVSESVVIGDTLGYQSLNARAAKETLLQRTVVLEEYQSAAKVTITKRRIAERLKGSSSIASNKVDDAIDEMEEAKEIESVLFHRLDSISQNLHRSLHTHSRQAHEDIAIALLEHARMNIMYERSVLKELEVLRTDMKNITAVGGAAGIRRANIPPALERKESISKQAMPPTRAWVEQPRPQAPPSVPSSSSSARIQPQQQQQPPPSQQQQRYPQQQQYNQPPIPPSPSTSTEWVPRNPSMLNRPNPTSFNSSSSSSTPPTRRQPSDLTQSLYQPSPSSQSSFRPSPNASSSSSSTPSFVPPSRQQQQQQQSYQPHIQPRPQQQPPSSSSSASFDPLGGGGGGPGPSFASSSSSSSLAQRGNEPLMNGGGGGAGFNSRGTGGGLTQSFYSPAPPPPQPVQPVRKRLDPREAASKLAKGF